MAGFPFKVPRIFKIVRLRFKIPRTFGRWSFVPASGTSLKWSVGHLSAEKARFAVKYQCLCQFTISKIYLLCLQVQPKCACGRSDRVKGSAGHLSAGRGQISVQMLFCVSGYLFYVWSSVSIGKTQVCLHAAAVTALSGQSVIYLQTEARFPVNRLAQIINTREYTKLKII